MKLDDGKLGMRIILVSVQVNLEEGNPYLRS